jgi:transposase
MEATGAYWIALATSLHEGSITVSVVNPSRTAFFARSQLRRTKTDGVDAQMIAEFCQSQQPAQWEPPAPQIRELRGFLSYRDHLIEERVRLKQVAKEVQAGEQLNELHHAHLEKLANTIEAIEKQIRALLKANDDLAARVAVLEESIAGIGFITAAAIVAKLPFERLRDAKAAAAFVGLTPKDRQSGTSVNGKPRICKTGDASLRRDLYMPALVAKRFNPILAAFAERLKERGKPPKVIIVAIMRKLIVLAYRLLKALAAAEAAAAAPATA